MMNTQISASKPWIKCAASLAHTGRPLTIKIQLLTNSLFDSFLVLDDASGSSTWIPIVPDIQTAFSIPDMTFGAKFLRYEGITVMFKIKELQDLELLVSHFGKAPVLMNTRDDRFKNENMAFLRRIKSLDAKSFVAVESGALTNLSPIVLNESAREIWHNCVKAQNTHFYMKATPLRFSFLTWNVASREPTMDVVTDMARAFQVPAAWSDVIVIALEEIDMSFKSVLTGSSAACDKWTEIVNQAKNMAGVQYKIEASESMGGVYCCALVRDGIFPPVRNCKTSTVKLGANGMLANKAAVMFHWTVGEATFVAICCHLAPHDQNWEQRNNQWHEIVEGLGSGIDYVLIMGDLNYRIVMSYEQCKEMVAQGRLAELVEKDQLRTTMKTDQVIGKFVEPPIKFNPTFKFDKASHEYDTSAKRRVPSWTDRILIKTSKPRMRMGLEDVMIFETDAIRVFVPDSDLFETDAFAPQPSMTHNFPKQPHCVCYRMIKNVFSDHRPVTATYKFQVPYLINERLAELNEVMRVKSREMTDLSVPKITGAMADDKVVIANVSCVWAVWTVGQTSAGISVTPSEGILMAGESASLDIDSKSGSSEYSSITIEVQRGASIAIALDSTA